MATTSNNGQLEIKHHKKWNKQHPFKLVSTIVQLHTIFVIILTPAKAQANSMLEITDQNHGNGFAIIQLNETKLIDHYNHFIHKINLTELEKSIIILETTINKAKIHSPEIETEINKLNKEFETIIPHHKRNKRQIIMGALANGTGISLLFGTINKFELTNIENHLKTSEESQNNIINQLNKQITINSRFQNQFINLTNHFNKQAELIEIKINQYKIELKAINQELIKFEFETMIKQNVQYIINEIHNIKKIILTSRLEVLSRDILTIPEMTEQNITSSTLSKLKLNIALYENCLLLIIEIPQETNEIYKTVLIEPVPNKLNKLELAIKPTIALINKDKIYYPTQTKINLTEIEDECLKNILKPNMNTCHYIRNTEQKIILIKKSTIVVTNADKQELEQNCIRQSLIIQGNYIIKFKNCRIKIDNLTFVNSEIEYNENIILPNTIKEINFTDIRNLNLERTHLQTFENLKHLEKIQVINSYHQYGFMITGIIILAIIIIVTYKFKKTSRTQKDEIDMEPLHPLRAGGVMISSQPNKLQMF